MVFYAPLWLGICFNAVIYWIVTVTLGKIARANSDSTQYERMIRRLRLYPLILIFCWAGATINRAQNVIWPGEPVFWLYLLQVSSSSS